ncbi:MAG: dTDP-glucose 4,6-dehydratase [Planctomycetes bacterium]|nr:dTDP-glucose 4,6-dehydratase [Planctomycetota bacterium]
MRILVTGGAGFIGSNLIHYLLATRPDVEIVNLDKLTYAGNLQNLEDLPDARRHTFLRGDVAEPDDVARAFGAGVDQVFHLAAESHVDRSILDSRAFIHSNVLGTQTLIDRLRRQGHGRLVHVSTDEVYGSLGPAGRFTETSPLDPTSPYAASKAASDLLVLAAVKTHGLDAVVTRCSNNYGPYQFPEKLIPLMITNALEDRPLPVYGDGRQVRDWIHVRDHCAALEVVSREGRRGEIYNIGGVGGERENLVIVRTILAALGKSAALIRHVQDRPAHDRRYAICSDRVLGLGWRGQFDLEAGLRETVRWYQEHRAWWEAVKSGAYRSYYEQQYGKRLG